MIKGILIDIGGTIIENNNFSFEKLFNKIYELNQNKNLSYDEYIKINKHLQSITYDNRKEKEIKFIDYFRYLQKFCDLQFNKSLEEIEIEVVLSITDTHLIKEVIDLLEYCAINNIKIVAVSNTTFSKAVVLKQLGLFGLEKYFSDILVSSDYLFRKPSLDFYKLAVKVIGLDLEELIFIGNDYICDIVGPNELGIKTCWLNINQEPNYKRINATVISRYEELINKLKA